MIMIEIMINERSAKIQFEYTLYGPGGTRLGATLELAVELGLGVGLGQALLLVLGLLLLLFTGTGPVLDAACLQRPPTVCHA